MQSKEEIIAQLNSINTEITDFYAELSPSALIIRPIPETWSPADHLKHLGKSVKPVSMGLAVPKILLRMRYGLPKNASRDIAEVVTLYRSKIAGGYDAGEYGPTLIDLPESEDYKQTLLKKWHETTQPFMTRVEKWQDQDLEKYGAPHPVIGMLTVRELLGWTAYHNWHHLTNVQKRLGADSSKLFEHLV